MFYLPSALETGRNDLGALQADISPAIAYLDANVNPSMSGGWCFEEILSAHKESITKCDELLTAVRNLYTHAGEHIQETLDAYAVSQDENITHVAEVWKALDSMGPITPIGRDTSGTVTAGPLPSTGLAEPQTNVGHWIFDVLSWPDYLSVGSWVRKLFAWLWGQFTGQDPWQQLWGYLGGDWDEIGKVASAWGELADYLEDSGSELTARMQVMLAGWYDSVAASACGEYFARAASAVDDGSSPLHDLCTKYTDVCVVFVRHLPGDLQLDRCGPRRSGGVHPGGRLDRRSDPRPVQWGRDRRACRRHRDRGRH